MTAILKLTDAQATTLERELQSALSHHLKTADKALRMCDMKTMYKARERAHGVSDLLHVLKMTRLGRPVAVAS